MNGEGLEPGIQMVDAGRQQPSSDHTPHYLPSRQDGWFIFLWFWSSLRLKATICTFYNSKAQAVSRRLFNDDKLHYL